MELINNFNQRVHSARLGLQLQRNARSFADESTSDNFTELGDF